METVTDFIFLISKLTADGDCSHEIKRCLPLGRKAMSNLEGILRVGMHKRKLKLQPRQVYDVKVKVIIGKE